MCSMVPVPDEADEDARRCVRERTELISERIGLTNRTGAVLATLGVSDYNPLLGTEVAVWPNCRLLLASHYLQTHMPRSSVCLLGWNWCSRRSLSWSVMRWWKRKRPTELVR